MSEGDAFSSMYGSVYRGSLSHDTLETSTRNRKRRTARGITCPGGRVYHPVLGWYPSCPGPGVYPILTWPRRDTPSCPGWEGVPHPDLAGGYPILSWRGRGTSSWPGQGVPCPGWGVPHTSLPGTEVPPRLGLWYPPPPQKEPTTSHSQKWHGTSWSIVGWRWGTPSPPPCGQTDWRLWKHNPCRTTYAGGSNTVRQPIPQF